MTDGSPPPLRPILVAAGYLNVDFVADVPAPPAADGRMTAGRIRRMTGGMAANVACAAARLDAPWPVQAELIAMAGDEPESAWTLAELEAGGVQTQGVVRETGGRITHCLILVQPDGRRAIISEPVAFDDGLINRRIRCADGDRHRILYVDGYRVPGALAAVRTAGALGWQTALDLDGTPAAWRTLESLQVLCEAFDYLFVNRNAAADIWRDVGSEGERPHDLARLQSVAGSVLAAASRTQALILTLGEHGALVVPRNGAALYVEPLSVRSVDTTGAGDVFAGVFLALMLHGADTATAARWAAAAAALSTLGEGAQGALPSAVEVQRTGLPAARTLPL